MQKPANVAVKSGGFFSRLTCNRIYFRMPVVNLGLIKDLHGLGMMITIMWIFHLSAGRLKGMGWIFRTIVWGLARRFLGLPGIAIVGVLVYLYFTRDFSLF